MPVIDVARRGARAARGLLGGSHSTHHVDDASAAELEKARKQVRRLRAKLAKQRAEADALTAEAQAHPQFGP